MNQTTDIENLLARQAIWDCLLRYTRGVDRLDRELALSAFHPDALIDQSSFKGDRETLVDWVMGHHREQQARTLHLMTNFNCEVNGDEAHAETYVTFYGVGPEGGRDRFVVGRYVDRFERRAGLWAISQRLCLVEGATDLDKNELVARFTPIPGSMALGRRDPGDPSYLRPLQIPRE